MPNTFNFDLDLAVDVLAHIQLSVDRGTGQWGQDAWCAVEEVPEDEFVLQPTTEIRECGTALCYAGWALALSGYSFRVNEFGDGWATDGRDPRNGSWTATDDIAVNALDVLGLSRLSRLSSSLFSAENELVDLYDYTARYAEITPKKLRLLVKSRMAQL